MSAHHVEQMYLEEAVTSGATAAWWVEQGDSPALPPEEEDRRYDAQVIHLGEWRAELDKEAAADSVFQRYLTENGLEELQGKELSQEQILERRRQHLEVFPRWAQENPRWVADQAARCLGNYAFNAHKDKTAWLEVAKLLRGGITPENATAVLKNIRSVEKMVHPRKPDQPANRNHIPLAARHHSSNAGRSSAAQASKSSRAGDKSSDQKKEDAPFIDASEHKLDNADAIAIAEEAPKSKLDIIPEVSSDGTVVRLTFRQRVAAGTTLAVAATGLLPSVAEAAQPSPTPSADHAVATASADPSASPSVSRTPETTQPPSITSLPEASDTATPTPTPSESPNAATTPAATESSPAAATHTQEPHSANAATGSEAPSTSPAQQTASAPAASEQAPSAQDNTDTTSSLASAVIAQNLTKDVLSLEAQHVISPQQALDEINTINQAADGTGDATDVTANTLQAIKDHPDAQPQTSTATPAAPSTAEKPAATITPEPAIPGDPTFKLVHPLEAITAGQTPSNFIGQTLQAYEVNLAAMKAKLPHVDPSLMEGQDVIDNYAAVTAEIAGYLKNPSTIPTNIATPNLVAPVYGWDVKDLHTKISATLAVEAPHLTKEQRNYISVLMTEANGYSDWAEGAVQTPSSAYASVAPAFKKAQEEAKKAAASPSDTTHTQPHASTTTPTTSHTSTAPAAHTTAPAATSATTQAAQAAAAKYNGNVSVQTLLDLRAHFQKVQPHNPMGLSKGIVDKYKAATGDTNIDPTNEDSAMAIAAWVLNDQVKHHDVPAIPGASSDVAQAVAYKAGPTNAANALKKPATDPEHERLTNMITAMENIDSQLSSEASSTPAAPTGSNSSTSSSSILPPGTVHLPYKETPGQTPPQPVHVPYEHKPGEAPPTPVPLPYHTTAPTTPHITAPQTTPNLHVQTPIQIQPPQPPTPAAPSHSSAAPSTASTQPQASTRLQPAATAKPASPAPTTTAPQPPAPVQSHVAPKAAAPAAATTQSTGNNIGAITLGGPELAAREQAVITELEKDGAIPDGAVGLTANFVGESQLLPDAVGDKNVPGGTAEGIGQWRQNRKKGLPPTLTGQADFSMDELEHGYPEIYAMITGKKPASLDEIVKALVADYERPADPAKDTLARQKIAQALNSQMHTNIKIYSAPAPKAPTPKADRAPAASAPAAQPSTPAPAAPPVTSQPSPSQPASAPSPAAATPPATSTPAAPVAPAAAAQASAPATPPVEHSAAKTSPIVVVPKGTTPNSPAAQPPAASPDKPAAQPASADTTKKVGGIVLLNQHTDPAVSKIVYSSTGNPDQTVSEGGCEIATTAPLAVSLTNPNATLADAEAKVKEFAKMNVDKGLRTANSGTANAAISVDLTASGLHVAEINPQNAQAVENALRSGQKLVITAKTSKAGAVGTKSGHVFAAVGIKDENGKTMVQVMDPNNTSKTEYPIDKVLAGATYGVAVSK